MLWEPEPESIEWCWNQEQQRVKISMAFFRIPFHSFDTHSQRQNLSGTLESFGFWRCVILTMRYFVTSSLTSPECYVSIQLNSPTPWNGVFFFCLEMNFRRNESSLSFFYGVIFSPFRIKLCVFFLQCAHTFYWWIAFKPAPYLFIPINESTHFKCFIPKFMRSKTIDALSLMCIEMPCKSNVIIDTTIIVSHSRYKLQIISLWTRFQCCYCRLQFNHILELLHLNWLRFFHFDLSGTDKMICTHFSKKVS